MSSLIEQKIARAIEHHHAGRLAEAEAIYLQVLQQHPDHADALNLLGLLAHQIGNSKAAVELLGRAIRINGTAPGYQNNLGLAYRALGRGTEAVNAFRTAVNLKADFAEAYSNLGNAYQDLGQLEEAESAYRRALALRPDLAEVYANLGYTLARYARQSRLEEAIEAYRRGLALRPASAQILNNLGNALRDAGQLEEAIACYKKAIAVEPGYPVMHSTLLCSLLYAGSSTPEDIGSAHRRFAAQFESPLKPAWPRHANNRDPDRRLKVGYVSADFYAHSVAYFIEPVLARHDRTQVETYAYYSRAFDDEMTARIKTCVDHWVPCPGLSDALLAERIVSDEIDILVDLAGHTDGNRLLAFARRPAPVQITYLGYPATTGLSAMDYRLTTLDVDPEGTEVYHSEQLYRLPRTLWCYRPPSDMTSEIPPTPALAKGYVTFGSMNNYAKISPQTITLWSKVLHAVPESRLLMTNLPGKLARGILYERFAAHGIGMERLLLHERMPAARFRALFEDIDIALDPFPYNGTTTTCETFWMGVPVVTLIGRTSVSRSGYALLKTVGLDELCARNEEDYARIAVALAGNLPRLNTLREGVRARVEASPLRDEAGFTRDIEQAYRTMWRAWCTHHGAGTDS